VTACAACGFGRKIESEGKRYDRRYKGLIVHDLRWSAVRTLVKAWVPETVAMRPVEAIELAGESTRDRQQPASPKSLITK